MTSFLLGLLLGLIIGYQFGKSNMRDKVSNILIQNLDELRERATKRDAMLKELQSKKDADPNYELTEQEMDEYDNVVKDSGKAEQIKAISDKL